MSRRIEIEVPALHPAQEKVVSESRRFNVLDMGRRWGKSLLGETLLAEPALDGYPVAWFAPGYKYLIEIWSEVNRMLAPLITRSNAQERRIELLTGGVIEFWTLETPDAGRSRKYKRAIVDEAAMVAFLMEFYQASLRPALTDYQGDAWFKSTPKGRNDFWQLWQKGLDQQANPDWACWQMPTSSNPYIPKAEIENARRTLPERIFAQEYEAKFLEDAGGVFRGVMQVATLQPQKPVKGDQYIFGVDWGKLNDFTVIQIIDVTTQQHVWQERFNQIDYTLQTTRLKGLAERYNPTVVQAESNAMGEPLIDQLRRDGLPMRSFTTTAATKAQIIESLQLAIEQQRIELLNDDILINELQSYEMTRMPSGGVRYHHPEGSHDDCVMSLAIAYNAAKIPSPLSLMAAW